MIQPVFLLSLPRSGSTLLQRLLAAHPDIGTTSEPWLLLPLIYALRRSGVYAEYGHHHAVDAIGEFAAHLPHGKGDIDTALRTLAGHLYAQATAEGSRYFLDKTPRYSLIVGDLMRIFPAAHFVFLWRNPLAAAASMMQTWRWGRWNLDGFYPDLYTGMAAMIPASKRRDRAIHRLRYEDLVRNPHSELERLFRFLDLTYPPDITEHFGQIHLAGRYGDQPAGGHRERLRRTSPDSWAESFNSPLRRRWARRYLAWLGDERLEQLGYRREELLRRLPRRGWGRPYRDLVDMSKGELRQALRNRILHRHAPGEKE